jgi:hypothetical protein
MEQPKGFKVKGQEGKVLHLLRTINRLKQATLAWWKALNKSMGELGFTCLCLDSRIFVNKDQSIIIIIYIDNVLFLGTDKQKLLKTKEQFMKRQEYRDLSNAQEFLCMCIRCKDSKIHLDQSAYLQKVIEHFNLQNAKPAPTPLPEGYQPSPVIENTSATLCSKYQQVIGSLLYIMLGTQPDIAFVVIKLSRFASNPTKKHLEKALYICCYLLGTPDYALVYDGPGNGGLLAYANSDWASDPNTRKSTSGYVVKLADAIFSWNMHAQKTIVLLSTEAEYIFLSDTSCQLIWVRNLFSKLSIELAPILLFEDNQGSIFIASNPVQEKHSKHIDLHYHYIRDVVQDGKVELFFVEGT